MKTVPGFEKKMSLYALTGAAALAASGSAGAAIVHVTVGQSFSSAGPQSTYNLSPTGNATPDISINAGPYPAPFLDPGIGASTSATAGVLMDAMSSNLVAALAFGDLINPASATNWGAGGKMIDNFGTGDWSATGGSAYLGFYFTDPAGVHAGWADISTSTNAMSSAFTVTDYAYETVGGRSITAGQLQEAASPGGSVPEPASIALLAMGAAGMAAVRRRRAHA